MPTREVVRKFRTVALLAFVLDDARIALTYLSEYFLGLPFYSAHRYLRGYIRTVVLFRFGQGVLSSFPRTRPR